MCHSSQINQLNLQTLCPTISLAGKSPFDGKKQTKSSFNFNLSLAQVAQHISNVGLPLTTWKLTSRSDFSMGVLSR